MNFADEKDVLRRKKKRSCGFDGRLITFIKIDLIDFCRVKEASSSKSSSTPLTIIVRKTPKTSARNSEKHFWTEKIDTQLYNFKSRNRNWYSWLKTKVSEVLTQSEKQIGIPVLTLTETVRYDDIHDTSSVGSRSPGRQLTCLITRGATLFPSSYPNECVNGWEWLKLDLIQFWNLN